MNDELRIKILLSFLRRPESGFYKFSSTAQAYHERIKKTVEKVVENVISNHFRNGG